MDWVLISLASLMAVGMICATVLIIRAFRCVQSLYNPRALETERLQHAQLVAQLVEKRDSSHTMTTQQLHTQERMHQAGLKAGVDRAEIRSNGNPPAAAPVNFGEQWVEATEEETV